MSDLLQNCANWIDWLLGLQFEGKDLGIGRMSLRALVVFILAIAILRIGDKRFLGRNTLLDVSLGIIFGSIVSRAITGNAPFFPALAASLTLVLLHFLLASISYAKRGFGDLVKGRPILLVKDGEIRWENMRSARVTENDLKEALRMRGHEPDVANVRSAHIERSGDISVIMK